jgi:quinate dehydrogenase
LLTLLPGTISVIPHLEGGLDDTATALGAVNAVFLDDEGRLRGSNTDWKGIEGALKEVGVGVKAKPTVAVLVGAGGAARAAAFALIRCFGVKEIYILNRDEEEVEQLLQDCQKMMFADSPVSLVHVKSKEQASELRTPSVVVGTVPDFEPSTSEEKAVKEVLSSFLARGKGVLLDMCYKPRRTRHIQLAQENNWQTVEGTAVIGHQAKALWRLWITDGRLQKLDEAVMWKVLKEKVEVRSR